MTKADNRRRFTFRIPKDLLEKVKMESQKKGVSLNAFILRILDEWIDERKKKLSTNQKAEQPRNKDGKEQVCQ